MSGTIVHFVEIDIKKASNAERILALLNIAMEKVIPPEDRGGVHFLIGYMYGGSTEEIMNEMRGKQNE